MVAFAFNALSFLFSAACICAAQNARRIPRPPRRARPQRNAARAVRPWHEYTEGLRYIRSVPLVFGLLHGRRRLGHRRRRCADSLHRLRRNGLQSRTHGHRLDLGLRRRRPGHRRHACLPHRPAPRLPQLQARHQHLLYRARRIVHAVQPDAQFHRRADLHRPLARGRGRKLRAQHVATAAHRTRRISADASSPPTNPCNGR